MKALAIWAEIVYNAAGLVDENPEIMEQLSPFVHLISGQGANLTKGAEKRGILSSSAYA